MTTERDPKDRRYARKTPCDECPFNKKTPEPINGGSTPDIYIGQICGPFLLSCHKDPGYKPRDETGKKQGQPEIMQCAGAAIFRANVGVAHRMPDVLHHLPADTELVDAGFAEFLARHLGVPLEEAQRILAIVTPEDMYAIELSKITQDKILLIPKEKK